MQGSIDQPSMLGQEEAKLLSLDSPWIEIKCADGISASVWSTQGEAVGERWRSSWEAIKKINRMQDMKSWRANAGPKWEVHEASFYGTAASRGLGWDLVT